MDNVQIAKEWFEYAKLDLKTALYLLDMKPKPNEIICYHCQQSAEKFLKGYLAIEGEPIKKTHDLQFLCKLASNNNLKLNDIEDDCIELTDYGVEVRYPFHTDVEDMDVDRAIKSVKRIKEIILKIVNVR
jgi:HEPN domain-containing protein